MLCVTVFCLLILGVSLQASDVQTRVDPDQNRLTFMIEDSHCLVGMAPVYLTVSELKPEGGNLIGTYEVRVPMKSSKNDHGKIVLPLNTPVGELGHVGGILVGEALSKVVEGQINRIVCEIIPEKDQKIKLEITTSNRTLSFESHYTVLEKKAVEAPVPQGES